MQTSYRFWRNHRDCSQYAGEPKLQIRVQPQRESQGYHGSNRGQRFNHGTDEDPEAPTGEGAQSLDSVNISLAKKIAIRFLELCDPRVILICLRRRLTSVQLPE